MRARHHQPRGQCFPRRDAQRALAYHRRYLGSRYLEVTRATEAEFRQTLAQQAHIKPTTAGELAAGGEEEGAGAHRRVA